MEGESKPMAAWPQSERRWVGIKALVIVGLLLVINRFISPSRRGTGPALLTVLTVLGADRERVVQIMLGLTLISG